LRHPLEVVFQEGIVGGISIHHGIGPNGSTMKDWGFWTDHFFDGVDDRYISMVVLLQKLEIKSISNLSLQNRCDLSESLLDVLISFLLVILKFFFNVLEHLGLVRLVLFITNVKGDLESIKIGVTILLNQLFEKWGCSLRYVQVELTLSNLVIIEVSRIVSVLIDEQEQFHNFSSEILRLKDILSNGESIAKVVFHLLSR